MKPYELVDIKESRLENVYPFVRSNFCFVTDPKPDTGENWIYVTLQDWFYQWDAKKALFIPANFELDIILPEGRTDPDIIPILGLKEGRLIFVEGLESVTPSRGKDFLLEQKVSRVLVRDLTNSQIFYKLYPHEEKDHDEIAQV